MSDEQSDKSQTIWYALDFVVCEEEGEAAQYALMELGATGTEMRAADARTTEADRLERRCRHLNVSGYFAQPPDDEAVRGSLIAAWKIYNHKIKSFALPWVRREVPARDWLAEWKANWQAVTVGTRFIIAPSWKDLSHIEDAERRHVIYIEPGMAFGTGTHETTRLCLEAIEKHFKGASFLDVGTGTGVLAIAAAMINPKARIEACDTDAEAVEIARENATVNHVGERIEFRTGSIDEATASADFVCANLTADVILPLLPTLIKLTCARLVLSGILAEQAATIETRLAECGITNYEIMPDGEWVAFVI